MTAPRQIVVSDLWSNGKATRWPTPSEMERWPGPETFETEFHAYLRRRPNRRSALHGENHWHAVAATGLELCKRVPAADPSTVFHFAMAHDAERRNDGIDPDHGIRAAQVFADRWPYLHDFDVFAHACVGHTSGTRSRDPTIGVCWDADRLNLWRIGIRPDPRFLSTAAARDPKMIEMARGFHGKRYTWNRLAYDYAQEVCVPRLIEEKYGPMRPRSYADQIPPVESLPLDEHGRALLYHGTDRLSANKITQSGLRPTEPWFGEEGKGVFLSSDFEEAISHAFWMLPLRREASDIVVFEVAVDPKRLRYDPEPTPFAEHENRSRFYVKTRIKASDIRLHWEGTPEQAEPLATYAFAANVDAADIILSGLRAAGRA